MTDQDENLDPYSTAARLIKQHGNDAAFVAAMWSDRLRDAGDVDGSTTWRRIHRAIEELGRAEPREDETVN